MMNGETETNNAPDDIVNAFKAMLHGRPVSRAPSILASMSGQHVKRNAHFSRELLLPAFHLPCLSFVYVLSDASAVTLSLSSSLSFLPSFFSRARYLKMDRAPRSVDRSTRARSE